MSKLTLKLHLYPLGLKLIQTQEVHILPRPNPTPSSRQQKHRAMRNFMKAPSALRTIFCCFPQRARKVSRVHATSRQPATWPLHSSSWSVHSSAWSSTPSWQSSTPVPSIIRSQPQSHIVRHSNPISLKALPSTSLLTSSNRAHLRATFQAQSQARAQSTQTEPPQDLQRTQPLPLPRQNWITRTYGRRWWGSSKLFEDSTILVAFSASAPLYPCFPTKTKNGAVMLTSMVLLIDLDKLGCK